MREAHRRILVASFPAPGVTNDPLLSKVSGRQKWGNWDVFALFGASGKNSRAAENKSSRRREADKYLLIGAALSRRGSWT
jgi:hypothetical protein